jgi:hypothetical protein
MRTKLRSKFTLLFMMLGLLLATPAVALADNIVDDVVVGGNDTITAGSSTTINYWIVANNGDGQTGCNASDGSSATVTINKPAAVSASAGSLTFSSCGTTNKQPVVFSSNTPGNYVISVSVSDSGTGSYNINPATFTLHVNPAPKVATSLSLSANPTQAYYSDNFTLTATLTKTSNGSAISGKTIQFKEGSILSGSRTRRTPTRTCAGLHRSRLPRARASVIASTVTATAMPTEPYT